MKIPIINKSANHLPHYARKGDAGMDLAADFSQGINSKFLFDAEYNGEEITIYPDGRALIPTNLYTAIPEGYEIQIRPRSGAALKEGITVLNTPGTIDSGFRNGWGVILINTSDTPVVIKQGERIAQAVLNKFETIEWIEVENLDESERGLTGFGDSGK